MASLLFFLFFILRGEGIKIKKGKLKRKKKRIPIPHTFLQHILGNLIPFIRCEVVKIIEEADDLLSFSIAFFMLRAFFRSTAFALSILFLSELYSISNFSISFTIYFAATDSELRPRVAVSLPILAWHFSIAARRAAALSCGCFFSSFRYFSGQQDHVLSPGRY